MPSAACMWLSGGPVIAALAHMGCSVCLHLWLRLAKRLAETCQLLIHSDQWKLVQNLKWHTRPCSAELPPMALRKPAHGNRCALALAVNGPSTHISYTMGGPGLCAQPREGDQRRRCRDARASLATCRTLSALGERLGQLVHPPRRGVCHYVANSPAIAAN